jgi:Fe-S cluster assembly ATPase SufC
MKIKKREANGQIIATTNADSIILTDEQSGLDVSIVAELHLTKKRFKKTSLNLVQILHEKYFKSLLTTILSLQS